MNSMDVFAVVSRWLHIGSAIGLVGGAAFLRYVVIPSAEAMDQSEHDRFRERLIGRWKTLVHAFIGLLLLSGVFNIYYRFTANSPVVAYHMILTLKILLALFVMFVASALVGRSRGLQPLRDNPKLWLSINIAIAAVIVMLSGVMRFLPNK